MYNIILKIKVSEFDKQIIEYDYMNDESVDLDHHCGFHSFVKDKFFYRFSIGS